jgi:hypothetical protein
MVAQSYSSLIDFATSWANAQISITPYDGALLDECDVSAIAHSGTVEVGEQMSGGRVKARTSGSVKYEASITLYRSGLQKLVKALVAAAPEYAKSGNRVRISLVGFDIDVHHSPPGATEIAHTRIKGCRLLGYSDDMSEGNDADQVELTLNPIENVNMIDGQEVVLL